MDREQRMKFLKKMGVDMKGAESVMGEYEEAATSAKMPSDYLIENLLTRCAIKLVGSIHGLTQDKAAARTNYLESVETDDFTFTKEMASQLFEETWEELEMA